MEVVGDGDARISYQGNWSVQNVTGADQGSVHTSTDPAAVISLEFVGSSIEIDAVKSPKGANFTVVLDTSTYGPYSLYSPTTTVDNVWSQSQLNPTATHTIAFQKVQASAGPDSTLALNIDVFRIATASSSSSSSSSTTVSSSSLSSTSQSTSTSSLRQEPISLSLIITNSHPLSFVLTFSPSNQRPAPSSSISEIQPTYNLPPSDTEPSPSPDDTYTNDVSNDPIHQPASLPTSTTSSRSSTTVSHNSTSSSSTRSATTIAAFSIPHSPSTSASAAAVDASADTPGPDNSTSIILGTIAGAVIFLCLITIPIVYIKRKREETLAQELKASTTPAYQTRTAKGLLMPLGIYRRPTSTTSPTSPTSTNHRWGFGSQTHYNNQSISPSVTSPSPRGAAGGRRTSFEDTERSHYLIFPDVAPGSEPVEFRGHGRTDSISSDYPYPVIYHTPQ